MLTTFSIIQFGYIAGTVIYLLVAVEYALILRRGGMVLLGGFLFSAIWHQANLQFVSQSQWPVLGIELLRYGVWSSVLLWLVYAGTAVEGDTRNPRIARYMGWGIFTVTVIVVAWVFLGGVNEAQYVNLGLIFSVATLLVAEQVLRHSTGSFIKLITISVASLVIYDIYLYMKLLVFSQVAIEAIQIRGLASTTAGLVICLAPLFISRSQVQGRKPAVTRPLAFSATSLILAGSLLLFLAAVGYTVQTFGEIERVIWPFLTFIAVLVIGLTLSSRRMRNQVRVWIDKTFFQHKYDYRRQWKELNRQLASFAPSGDYLSVALDAAFTAYDSGKGVIYLKQGDYYQPAFSKNINAQLPVFSTFDNQAFFQHMVDREWVFCPSQNSEDQAFGQFDHLIPEELMALDPVLLILPLVNENKLLGFVVLPGEPEKAIELDWEDLDLMRTVARQIANYVGYQLVAYQLIQTRQFDAYHKLTAFVIHDLKNLIANQAMVVENVARFKDDPEFMADAIDTIDHSVNKMNDLLRKLRSHNLEDETATARTPEYLTEVVREAVDNCSRTPPSPELIVEDEGIIVEANRENLVTSLSYLLRNAQEATSCKGYVQAVVKRDGNWGVCEIVDNGVGMDDDFVQNRLFKPFDSTKDSKGMGIGAFQCQHFINGMGGRIDVKSESGVGSCFTITLALARYC